MWSATSSVVDGRRNGLYVIIEMFPLNKPKPTSNQPRTEIGDFAYVNRGGLGVWLQI